MRSRLVSFLCFLFLNCGEVKLRIFIGAILKALRDIVFLAQRIVFSRTEPYSLSLKLVLENCRSLLERSKRKEG